MIKRLIGYYHRCMWSLEKQALHAGVHLGKNNFIASRFWSSEPYLIQIGNHCQITQGVTIHTHGGGNIVRDKNPDFDCFGKVSIGNYVYLGANSMVMPGVTIGDHVLVAAGSVVTKSIPSDVVVGGNPARIICTIDEYIKRNERFNLNSKKLSASDKKALLLSLPEEKFIHKTPLER